MRFFLIDRITRWEVASLAEATKNIALSEDFFDDHFPRRPVMPGVLILEGMAQLAGVLLEASLMEKYAKSAKAVLTVLERTKFRSLVKPGDLLHYHVEVLSVNEAGGKVKTSAVRAGSLVTSTEMVFAFKFVDDPQLDEKRRRLLEIWLATTPSPGAPASLPTLRPGALASLPAPLESPSLTVAGADACTPSNDRKAGKDAGAPNNERRAGRDAGAPGVDANSPDVADRDAGAPA